AQPHREPEKPRDHRSLLDGIMEHICYVASYDRPDRLFPGDPKLFVTNPLSLAYGAGGVAYAIKKLTGSDSRPIIDWVLEHSISPETYAAGLYVGISGIAWGLLEIGEQAQAERLFELTFEHRLRDRSFDLCHGSAGWGMTSLRFFLETGNELY